MNTDKYQFDVNKVRLLCATAMFNNNGGLHCFFKGKLQVSYFVLYLDNTLYDVFYFSAVLSLDFFSSRSSVTMFTIWPL